MEVGNVFIVVGLVLIMFGASFMVVGSAEGSDYSWLCQCEGLVCVDSLTESCLENSINITIDGDDAMISDDGGCSLG